eukprot:gnl/TRDRNA2_/TRDRNA2_136912_c0_seq4.p1 gnl/TRDRNA2_/TRDRNA2_136912_c0~~gnl/TRDRNA2_/TRDRNA2_136912_c0_seq4.p1  ORF type:complete len:435 (+),score=21.55 gnl/TRDRNA2_/TRDRNA2_136912_c0_seq4:78-1382(+)
MHKVIVTFLSATVGQPPADEPSSDVQERKVSYEPTIASSIDVQRSLLQKGYAFVTDRDRNLSLQASEWLTSVSRLPPPVSDDYRVFYRYSSRITNFVFGNGSDSDSLIAFYYKSSFFGHGTVSKEVHVDSPGHSAILQWIRSFLVQLQHFAVETKYSKQALLSQRIECLLNNAWILTSSNASTVLTGARNDLHSSDIFLYNKIFQLLQDAGAAMAKTHSPLVKASHPVCALLNVWRLISPNPDSFLVFYPEQSVRKTVERRHFFGDRSPFPYALHSKAVTVLPEDQNPTTVLIFWGSGIPHASMRTHFQNAQVRASCRDLYVVIPREYLDYILDELCAPRRSYLESITKAWSLALGWTFECGNRLWLRMRGLGGANAEERAEPPTQFLGADVVSMPALVLIGLFLGGRLTLPVRHRRSVREPLLAAQVPCLWSP